MRGKVDGQDRVARPGDEHVTEPGVPHTWWNDTDEPAHLRVEFRPALHTEVLFEHIFGLAEAGKTNRQGIPNLLRLAVLLDAYPDEFYPAGPPVGLVKAAFKVLAPVGRLRGYRVNQVG